LKTPAREIPTVAPDQIPGFKVIVPRSRFCSELSESGLTMFAVTEAFWVAAAAGIAPHSADQAAASANIFALVAIARPAACRRESRLISGMVDFRSTMLG
jgi:hypothetical protein